MGDGSQLCVFRAPIYVCIPLVIIQHSLHEQKCLNQVNAVFYPKDKKYNVLNATRRLIVTMKKGTWKEIIPFWLKKAKLPQQFQSLTNLNQISSFFHAAPPKKLCLSAIHVEIASYMLVICVGLKLPSVLN